MHHRGRILVVEIDRPERRNAVDGKTAKLLLEAFEGFEQDHDLDVAILTGQGGDFCAGADLKALAAGDNRTLAEDGPGPMGPTRLRLTKPTIAAVEGYCVAGGLELALWCDLRVAGSSSVFGVFNRRFGVPLIDLGTIRLPRLIGHGRALDLILTGRSVDGKEALQMGLIDRLVDKGTALDTAIALAEDIARFPQKAMRNDRMSVYQQWSMEESEAMRNELRLGIETIASGEAAAGAAEFAEGKGRGGNLP